MTWFLSRQCYWPDGDLVIEIAAGGADYANAGMLADPPDGRYDLLGCTREYSDPREALEVAFRVRDLWNEELQGTGGSCRIETGYTAGWTMPFMSFPDDECLRKWAQERWNELPKCDQCGEPYTTPAWYLAWDPELGKFCSEGCCDRACYEYECALEEDR